jgi:uncharacterized protein
VPHSVSIEIPETLPIMVLSGATLFPHGYMPLFIFEERYREMLNYALERDRMFCIGHTRPGIDPETNDDPVHATTTAGLIRACVTHPDGTSHLMLAGLQRVEIIGWEQRVPFRIASVIPLPSLGNDTTTTASRALDLVDLCGRLGQNDHMISKCLGEHLRGIKDPSAVADLVAQTFLTDPAERQRVLEMVRVEERLELLLGKLSQILAQG